MTQRPGDLDALGRPCDPALRGLYGFPMSPDRTTLVDVRPRVRAQIVHRAELRDAELLWTRQLNAMDWSTEGRSGPTAPPHGAPGLAARGRSPRRCSPSTATGSTASLLPADETPPLVVSDRDAGPRRHRRPRAGAWTTSRRRRSSCPAIAGADPSQSRYAGSDPGGHDGWVVVPIVNDDGFRVEVFDAGDVGARPARHRGDSRAMTVPFVLHSAWMPRAVSTAADGRRRNRFADELDRIGELPDDLAAVANQVIDDLAQSAPLPA